MKKSTLKFYTTLLILGLCFHLTSSFATKSEFEIKPNFVQSFISTSTLTETPLVDDYDYNTDYIEKSTLEDKTTKAANVLVLISRILIAVSGAIFGIKNIFKKEKNESNI
jgi:hypothetical protein